ncbi:diaminopimelate epimerase [Roseomonas marmotae]|uniref:Diaminopimelate epimerase n=1 Tax=Roseomonas marmotae TaxID=2768161 RepID=A0ABS3KG28_9PROT|nr:diaminopimelate epimerase [Roseomonas marmotae]MBO1076399.1 diaminopimelate epimerase [Roseomonas marmotae]QTI79393.1 diaminopimelate epimerase [Roseomonas marmotae]
MIPFRKMHGLGNDFVVVDDRRTTLGVTPARAAAAADRHRGIGCDQFIVLEQPGEGADVFMRIYNPDGSEAEACGNATRCIASLLMAETGRDRVVVRTLRGDLPCERLADGTISADMGPPSLEWQDVPLARAMDTAHLPMELGAVSDPAACSMGNPHVTFFVGDLDGLDWQAIGPRAEHHALLPARANIGFAQVMDTDHIRLAIWERGAGPTLACGSGACATLVNAHRRGLTGRRARIDLPGGTLTLEWRLDGHVLMAGPVATAFLGQFDWDSLAA